MKLPSRTVLWPPAAVAAGLAFLVASCGFGQAVPQTPSRTAILVELFTSEGCSSCPPADELLRQINGHVTASGQLIVGLSEHVSYWDGLGWRDPYSSEQYTRRQYEYSSRLGLDSVYTPQMIVNGREQFSGGDRHALQAALNAQDKHKSIALHIISVQVVERALTFRYSASDLPGGGSLDLTAVLVDDVDQSNVLRGENTGRQLTHVSVARALAPLGKLQATEDRTVSFPLPESFVNSKGHHLVIFAQQSRTGSVVGVDAKPM